ncbi:hypothetical protein EDB83DRAFT_2316348 [Lactarius deliciosus]|nr:hypothetical protein EDB83DRAFT_2316348 [Lactarius deliciosus]
MRPPAPPFPFVQEGHTRGAQHPFPLATPLCTHRQGASEGKQGQAAPSRGAPFARQGAHEASRLPTCRAAGPVPSPCAHVYRTRTVAFVPEMPEEFLQEDDVRAFGSMTQEHYDAWRHIEASFPSA